MEYRLMGRTGVVVSPLSLGCWQFGDRVPPTEAMTIIDAALDAGINFIDTADVYGGEVGRSESIVAEALARSSRRDRVVLATKAFHPTDPTDPNARGVSRRYLVRACEASLKRLRTDRIDVYYLHRPNPGVPVDETLRALDDLIRAGKVLYIGTSTSTAWRLMEAIALAREIGTNRYVAESPPYSILERRIERELVPLALEYGVALNVWSPLAFGILSGVYRRGEAPPTGSRFEDATFQSDYGFRLNDRVYPVLDCVEELADEKGCSMAQFALAWVMQQPAITSAILGPESVEDLESALEALEFEITDHDRTRIDAAITPGTHVSSFYEESPPHAQTLSEINGPEAR
jgi:aryl-alcohol dehydrogenase-like predicted oxidoreductase